MNDNQFKKIMNESVKMIDGVAVIKECGQWHCKHEDYLQVKELTTNEDFCKWCDNNNVIPVK